MRYFDVEIVFNDGTEQTVECADRLHTHDNVLHIRRDGNYGLNDDLGSFPLVNIRSWKKVQR
ncbi:hypothetical protein [Glycomyces tarimensis]